MEKKTYFVVSGKVNSTNADEIKTAFLNSGAEKIHFVSYGLTGAKTVAKLLNIASSEWSCSKVAGNCTLEVMQERYNVTGHYECAEKIKKRSRKEFVPTIKEINYSELLKLCEQANINIRKNLSHLPPENINHGIPILSYGDGKYYIKKEDSVDSILVQTPNGRFYFTPNNENWCWNEKYKRFTTSDNKHCLKVNLGKAINKLYCDLMGGAV